jgi:hypothetical protein
MTFVTWRRDTAITRPAERRGDRLMTLMIWRRDTAITRPAEGIG